MQSPQTSQSTQHPRVRLADARASLGLSQQALAERIGSTYVNVSRWERGITKPSPYFRRKLCVLFGMTEEELDLLPTKKGRKNGSTATAKTSDIPAETTTTDDVAIPAPQMVALYDPAIPLQPSIHLVGRDNDLARIKARLCNKQSVSLTALNGLPGVGKTALSIALAHDSDVRAFFKDGVLWAGLGPNPNMPGLLSRWGNLLGISSMQMSNLNSNEAWAIAIRNAIGTRSMLLVIDDAWKLEEALTFRVGGLNCAHLVTTRFPSIAAAMTIDGATMIEALSEEDSIKLLGQLAPQVIDREQQRAHDLVQAVGGLPLALTLMGNYLRKQAYSGPARRITAALERLNNIEVRMRIEEPHVPAESHPSLPIEQSLSIQSVVAVTDQQLEEKTRNTFYALAVFPPKPNTFSEEAALAISASSYEELDNLSDVGLLENNSNDRYQLHQVIADYGRLQIHEEQLRAAQERLITYILNYVETHRKDYEQLEQESNTILTALDIAHNLGKQDALVNITSTFAPFLIMRGFYDIAKRHLERALKTAIEQNNENGKVRAFLYLGEVAQKQGDYAQAEKHFQEGLEIARQIDDKEIIGAFLNDLGNIEWRIGDYQKSEAYLQEGLALSRQIGNLERVSGLLKILGSVIANKGDYQQAIQYFQEGLAISQKIGDREQTCFLLGNLGVAATIMGNYAQANIFFQEGLALARQIGHREQICILLLNLGGMEAEQQHYNQAILYLQEGLGTSRQIGHREGVCMLLLNLGEVEIAQGNWVKAKSYLEEVLPLARQLGRPHIIARILHEYGKLHLHLMNIPAAEENFQEVLSITPKGSQDLIALANYGLAKVAAQKNDMQKAITLGEESFFTLKSIGNHIAEEVLIWLRSIKQ